MLILTRKREEKIHIGDDITIKVLRIDRGRVRLGIDAPRSVPVFLAELLPLFGVRALTPTFARRLGAIAADLTASLAPLPSGLPDPRADPARMIAAGIELLILREKERAGAA